MIDPTEFIRRNPGALEIIECFDAMIALLETETEFAVLCTASPRDPAAISEAQHQMHEAAREARVKLALMRLSKPRSMTAPSKYPPGSQHPGSQKLL